MILRRQFRLAGEVEEFGNRGSEYVGVQESDTVSLPREGEGHIDFIPCQSVCHRGGETPGVKDEETTTGAAREGGFELTGHGGLADAAFGGSNGHHLVDSRDASLLWEAPLHARNLGWGT